MLSFTVEILSYTLGAAILIGKPLRERVLLKKAGECKAVLTRKKDVLYPVVLCAAIALLVFIRIRSFSLFIDIVLRAAAVLALEAAVRDAICRKNAGIYKNLLIAGGKILPVSDIVRMQAPTNTEQSAVLVLDVASARDSEITLYFNSAQERINAEKALHSLSALQPA
jgi:hypothetical protein